MYYHSRCIVLKNMDYREADKLVTVFSEKEGKLGAVARGIKKPGSSLRACVQPFCHSLLFFSSGRDLELITQGKLLDFYGNSREDLERTLYAVYIMELLDKSLMDRQPLPQLYASTLAVLGFLNETAYKPLIIRYFEMSLLRNLGYQPVLGECVVCGKKNDSLRNFGLAEGGMLCNECIQHSVTSMPLSGESLALMNLLTSANLRTLGRVKASQPALARLEIFLEKFLEYHLERKFNMKSTIRMVKKRISIDS